MNTKNKTMEFLRGFASTYVPQSMPKQKHDADAHWAAFSRQLSDQERESIEAGGFESGADYGTEYANFFNNKHEE
jgi:hypothetical protein